MTARRVVAGRAGWMLALVFAAAAPLAPAQTPPAGDVRLLAMEMDADVRVPMRDGTTLSMRLWRPGAPGRYPVVLQHTPYLSDETQSRARRFVAAGYVYASLDRRGRGTSEGVFVPLEGTGADGADAIAWLAAQPWSDGRVATMGGSYRGTTQWQALAQAPDALKAAVPTASVYPGWDYPAVRGIPYAYSAQWLAFTSGRSSQAQWFADEAFWREKFLRVHRGEVPFARLAEISGAPVARFAQWLRRDAAAWDAVNPTPAQYAAMRAPILSITGYFDGDQDGAMRYYAEHTRYASADAAARHLLLIGPWDHAGTRHPTREVGGLRLGEAAVLDLDALQIAWFDHLLRGAPRPAALADRVNYYVLGEERWRGAPSLEAISRSELRLYLRADGAEGPRLAAAPGPRQPPSHYLYDPRLDYQPADWGLRSPRRDAFAGDDDGTRRPRLRFASAPLPVARTVCGRIRLDAWIGIDTPDTDVLAELHARLPDGQVVWLGEDKIRARFREGEAQARFPAAHRVLPWRFDRFWWTCRRLEAGSQLRLSVGPLDNPYYQRNFNSGKAVGEETRADALPATVRLHHDRRYPSVLRLPLADSP